MSIYSPTQTTDPTTWANLRPTHAARPTWLTEARAVADAAWNAHGRLVEAFVNGGNVTHDEMDAALATANAAEEHYADLWQLHGMGREPEQLHRGAAIARQLGIEVEA